MKTVCSCPHNVWVYIWKMTTEKVGHASIQVGMLMLHICNFEYVLISNSGGCSPKLSPNDHSNGEYISIHPGYMPSIGPTTIFPLPASLANSLHEDMEIEGSYKTSNIHDEESVANMTMRNNRKDYSLVAQDIMLPPDHTIQLINLDTNAMTRKIKEVRREVSLWQTTYQLFPNINILEFVYKMPHYLNYSSIDALNLEYKNLHTNQSFGKSTLNCTSLVVDILLSGGCQIVKPKSSVVPWVLTPNDLAAQLF